MVENRKNTDKIAINCPTSEGVNEVSERVDEWARAKRALHSKRTSERCERTSKQTSEWPSTYICVQMCANELTMGLMRGQMSKQAEKMRKWAHEPHTVVQNNREFRRKYWATRSSIGSIAHSFTCSSLLTLLAHSAAFICSLFCSLAQICRKVND